MSRSRGLPRGEAASALSQVIDTLTDPVASETSGTPDISGTRDVPGASVTSEPRDVPGTSVSPGTSGSSDTSGTSSDPDTSERRPPARRNPVQLPQKHPRGRGGAGLF